MSDCHSHENGEMKAVWRGTLHHKLVSQNTFLYLIPLVYFFFQLKIDIKTFLVPWIGGRKDGKAQSC